MTLRWIRININFRKAINALTKCLVHWYNGTNMNTVATNIRFTIDEYEDLRQLAYLSKLSVAEIIRRSIVHYKESVVSSSSDRKLLFDRIVTSSVKTGISTPELVKQGRKFE